VLGVCRKGAYREIAVMLPRIFEFAFSKNIPIAGYPIFLCHEITHEEVQKVDKAENADIEVAVPISGSVETTDNEEIRVYELLGGKMAKIFHKGPYEGCSQLTKNYSPKLQKKKKELSVLFAKYISTTQGRFHLKRYSLKFMHPWTNAGNSYNSFSESNFILFSLNLFILYLPLASDKAVFIHTWEKVLPTSSLNT
jgi:AraC family transcriptional regulator